MTGASSQPGFAGRQSSDHCPLSLPSATPPAPPPPSSSPGSTADSNALFTCECATSTTCSPVRPASNCTTASAARVAVARGLSPRSPPTVRSTSPSLHRFEIAPISFFISPVMAAPSIVPYSISRRLWIAAHASGSALVFMQDARIAPVSTARCNVEVATSVMRGHAPLPTARCNADPSVVACSRPASVNVDPHDPPLHVTLEVGRIGGRRRRGGEW